MSLLTQLSPGYYRLNDHGSGFAADLTNQYLDSLPHEPVTVQTEFIASDAIQQVYPHINFVFDYEYKKHLFEWFDAYRMHPELTFKNFLCSFNGSQHVSRKLLTAALQKFKWFNPEYCSKNFPYTVEELDGHISDYTFEQSSFYRKFFISDNSEDFFRSISSFGHLRFSHWKNIYKLEEKLTQSFLHLISETSATSYHPFVTEKFLYSIVTRGLFLAYAPPGWHQHLEEQFGFKRYTTLFDYRFDQIQNPVERLIELLSMISKFSVLTSDDWRDLYLLEQDTIEYNYNHYFSQDYLKSLAKYA